MKLITSADNALVKNLKKLEISSKERRQSNSTLLEGEHLISAYVNVFGPPELMIVNQSTAHSSATQALLMQYNAKEVVVLPDGLFKEISTVKTPTGLIAKITIPNINETRDSTFCVLLEGIQDPGNVGAILRSAAAAGATQVYCSQQCVDAWSPKVLRAGMGAHFVLNIIENADLISIAKNFNGVTVATYLNAKQSLFDVDLKGSLAFLIGNEGAGLSAELTACATHTVTIPMLGNMESLNAGAAAAVCFFERVRQLSQH